MLRLPPITCSPPSQITASVPRLEMKKMRGKVRAVPRTTAKFSCKRLLLASRYRPCSYGSRTNALTTCTPARFSCSTVFRLPSFCCTILKRGPILVKKKRKTPRIAGLDNPTTGQVFIDGVDIPRMSEGKLAVVRNSKIGMVFQAFILIPTLTAQENMEVPLYVGKHKGSPSARAKELLDLVGLSHRLTHRPNQLSGGEQQRVAIARALAADPAFVIADEPTGNLDASNGENVLQLIAHLREQTGKTFIIATHDPVVASHADRSIRIVDGRIASIDTVAEGIKQ